MSAGGGKCKCVVECELVFLNVCARFSAFVQVGVCVGVFVWVCAWVRVRVANSVKNFANKNRP